MLFSDLITKYCYILRIDKIPKSQLYSAITLDGCNFYAIVITELVRLLKVCRVVNLF